MSRLPFVLLLLSALRVFAVTPVGLRCEAQVDPVGVGEPKPHLSWRLDEGRQTAYQIMVKRGRDGREQQPPGHTDAVSWTTQRGVPVSSGRRQATRWREFQFGTSFP